MVRFNAFVISLAFTFCLNNALAENQNNKTTIKVGVASVLSGDLQVLGQNIVNTVETYQKHYLRHPITFVYEDAKKSGMDGLRAYQSLINIHHVDMLIGGTTSNGTLAGKTIINSSKTVLITPLTGGSNIDQAGPFVFRIGNSDIKNGYQQAEYFINKGLNKVALYTEETEYTQDIATFFKKRFVELGGTLVSDLNFLPNSTDFKSEIAVLLSKKPQAIFMSTQTGLAFGIFVKQLKDMHKQNDIEIHTNFVAAANPDAFTAAGDAIYGVYYMAPVYDKNNPELIKFFGLYKNDHKVDPMIAFHTAGTFDTLNMLQNYLDTVKTFDRDGFQQYLLANIKNYHGLMGTYSFDSDGNADIGFEMSQITR